MTHACVLHAVAGSGVRFDDDRQSSVTLFALESWVARHVTVT